jgi:hypothetical protein
LVNAQFVHEMKYVNLFLNRRIQNRRRLQPVAQGLVIQAGRSLKFSLGPLNPVPVVNKLAIECHV